jgi:RNA-directed DNA polymerase
VQWAVADFDSVDHDLMVKAVEVNTDQSWVVLYVKRRDGVA